MLKVAMQVIRCLSLLCFISVAHAENLSNIAPNTPIAIVVFSAFTCPYCAEGKKLLEQLTKKYPGKIQVIFKHYPLGDDESAVLPHRAALAAQEQGKFWEMHDQLYDHQAAVGNIMEITSLATKLNLNMDQFNASIGSQRITLMLGSDLAEANAFNVTASPTFFINGFKLEGLHSSSVFEEIIDYKLAKLKNENTPTLKSMIDGYQTNPSPLIERLLRTNNK